jgi:hypothetical protein
VKNVGWKASFLALNRLAPTYFERGSKEVNNMNLTKNLGMLLLGIWLIVTGLLQVVTIQVAGIGIILAVLAIVAGVLILMGR